MTETTSLYVIKDRLSGVPESSVIESINDCIALKGFMAFLEKDNVAEEEHNLFHVATLDKDKKVIDTKYYLVSSGDNAKETFESLKEQLLGQED